VVGDLKKTIASLNPKVAGIQKWVEKCKADKWEHRFKYNAPGKGIYAPGLLKSLSEKAGDKFIAACDVGQHQMWVAQHCEFAHNRAHLTSGGSGAMGYGLPAGVGAKRARPDAHVVTISGDGSFMMNIQEMASVRPSPAAPKSRTFSSRPSASPLLPECMAMSALSDLPLVKPYYQS
jgi:acetolactate synthase-1/2/3 large subunit